MDLRKVGVERVRYGDDLQPVVDRNGWQPLDGQRLEAIGYVYSSELNVSSDVAALAEDQKSSKTTLLLPWQLAMCCVDRMKPPPQADRPRVRLESERVSDRR